MRGIVTVGIRVFRGCVMLGLKNDEWTNDEWGGGGIGEAGFRGWQVRRARSDAPYQRWVYAK